MNSDRPCMGCPDRYPGCSDHCRKEAFLIWKEKQEKLRMARRKGAEARDYMARQVMKNRGKRGR